MAYFLLKLTSNSTTVLNCAESAALKEVMLGEHLREFNIELIKSEDNANKHNQLYALKTDKNTNRYDIFNMEITPPGYIYAETKIKHTLYQLEWSYYKPADNHVYKKLINDEFDKFKNKVTMKNATVDETGKRVIKFPRIIK